MDYCAILPGAGRKGLFAVYTKEGFAIPPSVHTHIQAPYSINPEFRRVITSTYSIIEHETERERDKLSFSFSKEATPKGRVLCY